LLQHPGVPREVDHQALDLYLALRYVPGPRTMFKNIFKLQPAHWMTVDETGIKIGKYWDLQYNSVPDGRRDVIEEFRQLLEESVRLRLIAEVPLGVFLSGGLDSSAMLALMSRLPGESGSRHSAWDMRRAGLRRRRLMRQTSFHLHARQQLTSARIITNSA